MQHLKWLTFASPCHAMRDTLGYYSRSSARYSGGVTAIHLKCTASKSAGNRHARHHNICMHDQPTSSVGRSRNQFGSNGRRHRPSPATPASTHTRCRAHAHTLGGYSNPVMVHCKSAGNRHAQHHNICMHDQPTSSVGRSRPVWKQRPPP